MDEERGGRTERERDADEGWRVGNKEGMEGELEKRDGGEGEEKVPVDTIFCDMFLSGGESGGW